MSSKDTSHKTKWLQMRSCKRISSRIPVLVEWSEGGQRRTQEALTHDIGRLGCLLVVTQELAVQQRVRLTNQDTHQSAEASVAWKDHKGTQGWELGLELFNPPASFWGPHV